MQQLRAIDLFAGAGGSSEGARQAGAHVLWAANHWPLAVDVHRRNHPETAHACQDLHQCDWSLVPSNIDLVLASPACQGHSSAGRTAAPGKRDAQRSTAWAVVSCLEVVRAPVCVIENVPDFLRWQLYPAWRSALEALGYHLTEHIVQCADLGVPQKRTRLFLTAALGRPLPLVLGTVPRLAAHGIREDRAARWRAVADLPSAAQARIARASVRHHHPEEFVVHYVRDDYGHLLSEPLPTITTKHQFAWVRRTRRGLERRMFTGREYARAQGIPDGYELTDRVTQDCKLVGNAVPPPVMRAIVQCVAAARRGRAAA